MANANDIPTDDWDAEHSEYVRYFEYQLSDDEVATLNRIAGPFRDSMTETFGPRAEIALVNLIGSRLAHLLPNAPKPSAEPDAFDDHTANQWRQPPQWQQEERARRSSASLLAGGMSGATRVRRRPQQRPVKPRVYSVEQTSQVTNLSIRKINQMICDGRLRSIRIDGRRLIFVSSVEALLPDDSA
jgi:hypothetical protein